MFRKSLIAISGAAALLTTFAVSAQADEMWRRHHHHSSVNIGIGFGGFAPNYYAPQYYDSGYNGYYDNGYYDDNYVQDCGWQWRNVKRWNSTHTRFMVKHKKVWFCN